VSRPVELFHKAQNVRTRELYEADLATLKSSDEITDCNGFVERAVWNEVPFFTLWIQDQLLLAQLMTY